MASLSSMSRTRSSSVLPLMPSAAIDASLCAERPDIIRKDAAMSLSRDFAAFVANLRYGDLPEAVVDRAKGVTLQALSSALLGSQMPASRQALALIQEEEAGGGGAGTVLGMFGAAVAAAKIGGLDAEQVNGAIAQCVNLASGNLEGGRSGGRALREGGAVRNALLAVALAKHGTPGGETTLEGEAGFYHSYAGNNLGLLRYSFTGDNRADLSKITAGLGRDWMFLETLYRIYSTAGYNIAHVAVTARLCEEHDIRYEQIERIEAVVNWLETEYPSPAFPSRGIDIPPRPGSTQYFTAYG